MQVQLFEPTTINDFQSRIINEAGSVVLMVTTPWSGACYIIKPLLDEVVPKYKDRIRFFVLDYDSDRSVDRYYAIKTFPTMLFFRQGQLVKQLSGVCASGSLLQALELINRHH